MNRRNFLGGILVSCVAPLILPSGNRIWKRTKDLYLPTNLYISVEIVSQINPSWKIWDQLLSKLPYPLFTTDEV